MCPVSDALFIEFWAITSWHTIKDVVDGWANTVLCTKAQFHLMGNSDDTVIDGCSLFVVEVRPIWKGECSESSTPFCDETIEDVLVSVLFLFGKSSLMLFALPYLPCCLVVLWFIPKGIPFSQKVLVRWPKRVQFLLSLVSMSSFGIFGVAQSLYGVLIDECQAMVCLTPASYPKFDAINNSRLFLGRGEQRQIRVARWTTRIWLLTLFLIICSLLHLLKYKVYW